MVMQANLYDDTHVQGSLKPFVFNQKSNIYELDDFYGKVPAIVL